MADNVTADAGTGGATFAADDIGGVHFPRTKLVIGADGVNDGDVASGNPLPVTNAGLTELAGAINASAQMDVNIAASAATVAVSNAGLTELAAAVNASSQMDVNIAASGATVPVSNAGLTALNGAIAGTEVQVDVLTLPALAAGTNNIGDVDVLSIAAGDNNIGNVDIVTVPAPLSTTGGGTEATALRVTLASDSTGVVSVDDNGGALTVDNGGTFAVQAASAGDVAHDGADSGNPVKVGAKAIAHGANPTAVAAADRTDLYANRHGIQFVIGGHPNAKSATYLWTAATTDDNVLAAISAGTKYAVTRITITMDEANTVGVAVRLGFGTANVPALPAANGDAVDDILFYHPGMVPGSGAHGGDGSGILGVGGDGAELRITAEATTGGTGVVTVTYFTIES